MNQLVQCWAAKLALFSFLVTSKMDLAIQQGPAFLIGDKPIRLLLIINCPLFCVVHCPRVNLAGLAVRIQTLCSSFTSADQVIFLTSGLRSSEDFCMACMWGSMKNSAQMKSFEMQSPLKIWHQEDYILQKLNERLEATCLDLFLTTLIRGELTRLFI